MARCNRLQRLAGPCHLCISRRNKRERFFVMLTMSILLATAILTIMIILIIFFVFLFIHQELCPSSNSRRCAPSAQFKHTPLYVIIARSKAFPK